MKANPDTTAELAAAWLTNLGYHVERIPEGPSKTCDLRAEHPTGQIWIECKQNRLREDQGKALAQDGMMCVREPLGDRHKTADHARQAEKQLRATAPPGSVGLLWVDLSRPGSLASAAAVHCCLFGVRWFKILSGPQAPPGSGLEGVSVVPVYLGNGSVFQNHPTITAAVILTRGQIGLHVSPFSSSRDTLFGTRSFQLLRGCGGVFDLERASVHPSVYAVSRSAAGRGVAAAQADLLERRLIVAEPVEALEAGFSVTGGGEQGALPWVPGADVAALSRDVLAAAGALASP